MANKQVLTIERNYCENWTVRDAIREIIQNAIDTGTDLTFEESGDFQVICDNGIGVHLSDFILGKTSKRDTDAIGQFGEGMKIGCLVFAREGRQVHIQSLGKNYVFSLQFDERWQSELLTIDITDSGETRSGTQIYLQCSDEELEEARNLFLKFSPATIIESRIRDGEYYRYQIMDAPGTVWVNGLKVTEVDSVYGYNFFDKDLVNRDRSAINQSSIREAIATALTCTKTKEIMETLLTEGIEFEQSGGGKIPIEYDVMFSPSQEWRTVIHKLYGKRVCLSCGDPSVDLAALERNWVVLMLPWGLLRSLGRFIEYSTDVINKDIKKPIPLSKLKAGEKRFFERASSLATMIASEACLNTYPIKIFSNPPIDGIKIFEDEGYADHAAGIIAVSYSIIQEQDYRRFIGTAIHEYAHMNGRHTDNTRAFENDLTDIIADLGLTIVLNKEKARIPYGGLNMNLLKERDS